MRWVCNDDDPCARGHRISKRCDLCIVSKFYFSFILSQPVTPWLRYTWIFALCIRSILRYIIRLPSLSGPSGSSRSVPDLAPSLLFADFTSTPPPLFPLHPLRFCFPSCFRVCILDYLFLLVCCFIYHCGPALHSSDEYVLAASHELSMYSPGTSQACSRVCTIDRYTCLLTYLIVR